ncbi:MAG: MBL fold metallo-hydrolase [candidate division NC10 bacterium]|nr:MBL fold metallo-hydrolase [candidate division NC10 bacterium]
MGQQKQKKSSGWMRRHLLLALAALAAGGVSRSRLAWAQSTEPGPVARTLRFFGIWWDRLTQEPDPSDHEAKDPTKYVAPVRPAPRSWSSGGITATWIGHCTFLINLEGTTILTDPVFSEKIGIRFLGLATFGVERFVPPALALKELPPIDLVLLSHAHMDHYDIPTLRRLPREVPMILARDTTEFIEDLGFANLQELEWGQSAEVKGVRIEALPVKHWGRRYPWDHDRGYNGLLLTKHQRSILFGGDTALTQLLPAAVQDRQLDAVMLSIGAYNPYIQNHASPENAWEMFNAMQARYLIPMHWRTFRLSREHPFEPYQRLAGAVNGSASRIALHAVGATWSLPS